MFIRFAALLIALTVPFVGACASHETDVPTDQMLGTPKQTIGYLRWAFTKAPPDDRPRHVWNCLSEDFRRENKITLSDLELFWKEVDENLRRYLGDFETITVKERRDIDRRHAELDLESGDHLATVLFTLETEYEIRPWSGRVESVSGAARSMSDTLRYEGDRAVVELPNVKKEIAPEDVYRITLQNGWKVDRIVRHNLLELERAMRTGKKSPEAM